MHFLFDACRRPVSWRRTCGRADLESAKVTLVSQRELPNVPGESIKGALVEYGPGGYSPCHFHPKSAFIYVTVL